MPIGHLRKAAVDLVAVVSDGLVESLRGEMVNLLVGVGSAAVTQLAGVLQQ